MNTEPQINNRLFIDTIVGVLLLIAAFAFALIESRHPQSFHVPYIAIITILGSAALFILYRAMRADRYRLNKS